MAHIIQSLLAIIITPALRPYPCPLTTLNPLNRTTSSRASVNPGGLLQQEERDTWESRDFCVGSQEFMLVSRIRFSCMYEYSQHLRGIRLTPRESAKLRSVFMNKLSKI